MIGPTTSWPLVPGFSPEPIAPSVGSRVLSRSWELGEGDTYVTATNDTSLFTSGPAILRAAAKADACLVMVVSREGRNSTAANRFLA
jgi:hypothetical protein